MRSALKAATLAFIATLAIFAVMNYNGKTNNYVVNMTHVQGQSNMITSKRVMEICTNQTDTAQLERHCTTYSTRQTLTVEPLPRDQIQVTVFYEEVNITKTTEIAGHEIDINSIDSTSSDDFDMLYKCQLSNIGQILSIQQVAGQKYEAGVRLTERLLAQTFPDIRATLYNKKLLRGQEIVHEGYLGDIIPEFEVTHEGGYTHLSKHYDEDDIVNFQFNLGGERPEVEYNSEIIINDATGVVEHSEMSMLFQLDETKQMHDVNPDRDLISHDDRENVYEEILGTIDVEIHQEIETVGIMWSEDLYVEQQQYISSHVFETVDLKEDQGEMEILESNVTEPEFLLGQSAVHTKKWDIFKKSILGQTVALGVEWNNFENYSNIDANIWLNNKKLYTIYSLRLDHPWLACNPKTLGWNQEKTWQIFKVTYPIAGIITIPVTASMGVKYGYNFEIKNTKAQNQLCNVNLKPYLKPLIEGKGGANILKVAEGGVYGRGYVADTTLDFGFQANVINLSYGRIYGVAEFRPFGYEVGAYYWVIKCTLKKFFKKLFSFKWNEICQKGPEKRIPFVKDSLGGTQKKTIFDQSITLKFMK